MKNHKYSLAKKGKTICPKCGQKRFVLYINTETGKPLHSTVGKCDREDSCLHHYTPKQYFADNNISFDNKKEYTPISKPTQKPQPIPSYIDTEILKQSLQGYESNNLVKYLHGVFGAEVATQAIERYFVGTSKNGSAVFWQIDLQGKVRAGKVMLYDTTGHRRKDVPFPVQWVHSLLKLPNYNLSQCLFGEHLLQDTIKKVAIVESEKTAIIASCYIPDMIWLATGSSNGLNIDKCQCLKGRTVVLYPDAGCFNKWSKKAKEISTLCSISVSSLIENNATDEQRNAGYDLADYLVKEPFTAQIKAPQQSEAQTSQPITADATAHETKQGWQLNDNVLPTKKEAVDFTNEINNLANFFASVTLPETPIKVNAWTTINNPQYFVESSLYCLRAHSNNVAYLPYLNHLQRFKDFINH